MRGQESKHQVEKNRRVRGRWAERVGRLVNYHEVEEGRRTREQWAASTRRLF